MQLDDVADFRERIERSLLVVEDGSSTAQPRKFITRHDLRTILTRDRLRKLLPYPVDWEVVQHSYQVVFSILILIGKIPYISYFIQYHCLEDKHLPFHHNTDWPPECQDFFQQFWNIQWQLCPQTLERKRLNNTRFPQEAIVPVIRRKPLKEGITSSTYEIDIHHEYNLLAHAVSVFYLRGVYKDGRQMNMLTAHISG